MITAFPPRDLVHILSSGARRIQWSIVVLHVLQIGTPGTSEIHLRQGYVGQVTATDRRKTKIPLRDLCDLLFNRLIRTPLNAGNGTLSFRKDFSRKGR
jgi:hypothetical protein